MGRTRRWISAAPALALMACTVTSGPPPPTTAPGGPAVEASPPPATPHTAFTKADPATPPALSNSPTSPAPTTEVPKQETTDPPTRACKLPAPKKSEDACKQDSECGVSDPCHAAACVAKAKSNPPKADTVCTRMLACHSADVNRCGCFEGRCALIPP
jgi:hypothetical protein